MMKGDERCDRGVSEVKRMYEDRLRVHERIPAGFPPAHESVMPAEHKSRLGQGKGKG